ncbi:LuxR C-terminal-related transcriptional regulator [Desulfospira joergensenii]|uniref:LuxR C-terminal-related transcriptional regulator n=1 Tax=Desulfospira joergensenii TaxID=53329 RepID=UPI0003B56484|nr:LuxR C-terminal-related transcriptional regulator [Desulfospira joergensenii]
MERIGFYNLSSCSDGHMGRPGSGKPGTVMACFWFEQDIRFLFPYINAVAQNCEFHENLGLLRFEFEGSCCVLYPDKCIISPLEDHEHAKAFVEKLMGFLNAVLEKKKEIPPKFRPFEQTPVTKIIKILPGTNCGECGLKTCMAFAAMLSKQKIRPSECPHMVRPVREQITYPVMDEQGRQLSQVTFQVDTADPSFSLDETIQNKKELESGGTAPLREASVQEQKIDSDRPEYRINGILPEPLSAREIEVLRHMGHGLTNREISDLLFISPHTVKTHVAHIFNKLGVNHRVQAVVWAARQGLV